MANQIGGVAEIKTEKAANLSFSKQTKSQMSQADEQKKAYRGDQMLTPLRANAPDVDVIINGEKKQVLINEQEKEITPDDAKKMSEALNEFMDKLNCNIQFNYHEELDLMTIQMINKTTKEVIKEFPPEEILKTMEKTKEWIGMLLDKKA